MAADDAGGERRRLRTKICRRPRAARAAFRSAARFATVAAIGGLLFGYDISTTNRAVKALQADFHIGNALLGFAAASGCWARRSGRCGPAGSATGWAACR